MLKGRGGLDTRGDVLTRRLWESQTDTIIDVRFGDSDANTYKYESMDKDWFQTTLYTYVKFSTSWFLFCFTPTSYLERSLYLDISYIRSIFTQILVLYFFRAFLEANVFSSPWKVVPRDQQQPVHRFPSHQQAIKLNDWWNIQSMMNKVSIFGSSLNNWATVQSVYILISSTAYSLSSNHTTVKEEM